MATFHCADWPRCGCPEGVVHPECPGLLDRRNHIVLMGEGLTAEIRSRNSATARKHYALAVVVLGIALGWAFYAANAAAGIPA